VLELGEEVLAEEALVGAREEARRFRQAAQALAEEAPGAGRGGGMAVAKLRYCRIRVASGRKTGNR
jgi:hypothetical protein